jgi:hypothetical protein
MNRNMKAANSKIFAGLDGYCEGSEHPVPNAGEARWITTTEQERDLLIEGRVTNWISFSPSTELVRVDHGSNSYFCAVGFTGELECEFLDPQEMSGAILTILLSERGYRPIASTAEVSNAIGALHRGVESYSGHDPDTIAALFPRIAVLNGIDILEEETFRVFFRLSLSECRGRQTWLSPKLVEVLKALYQLNPLSIPYRNLCRSIFDSDPSAFFLALYRCLEAVYAYRGARALIDRLKLKDDWEEIAFALEETLSWHPKEESSLSDVLTHSIKEDFQAIFGALNEEVPEGTHNLSAAAAKRVYRLRNALVHFRPYHRSFDLNSVKWDDLCLAMANIVYDAYAQIYHYK